MPDGNDSSYKREDQQEGLPNTQEPAHADNASPGASTSSVLAFCEQIRKDAQAEIETILGRARHAAERKGEDALKEAERISREGKTAAEAQGKRIQTRATSGVSLEMKKMILRARGEIIQEVLARVRDRLQKTRATKEYSDFLKELTVQAIVGLDEEDCIIAPGKRDKDLFTPELIQQIAETLQRGTGREVRMSISHDLSPEGAGVAVYSASQRAVFDNTLDARMERLAEELRAIIAREVFVSDDSRKTEQNKIEKQAQA